MRMLLHVQGLALNVPWDVPTCKALPFVLKRTGEQGEYSGNRNAHTDKITVNCHEIQMKLATNSASNMLTK